MQSNQKGFSPVYIVLLVVVLGAAGFVGYRVFSKDSKKDTTISSFAECKAAGNPIMESYPEQCAANGKTFTNPNQKAPNAAEETATDPNDETASWLNYTSSKKTFTVSIPDGWNLLRVDQFEHLYGRGAESIVYEKGTKAKVAVTNGGWDGPSTFSLYVPGSYADQIVRQGTEQGTVANKDGALAHKYYYVEPSDGPQPEGLGNYERGAVVYNYYFDADGKNIQIEHVVDPGTADQHETVEKMIKTLHIN